MLLECWPSHLMSMRMLDLRRLMDIDVIDIDHGCILCHTIAIYLASLIAHCPAHANADGCSSHRLPSTLAMTDSKSLCDLLDVTLSRLASSLVTPSGHRTAPLATCRLGCGGISDEKSARGQRLHDQPRAHAGEQTHRASIPRPTAAWWPELAPPSRPQSRGQKSRTASTRSPCEQSLCAS